MPPFKSAPHCIESSTAGQPTNENACSLTLIAYPKSGLTLWKRVNFIVFLASLERVRPLRFSAGQAKRTWKRPVFIRKRLPQNSLSAKLGTGVFE